MTELDIGRNEVASLTSMPLPRRSSGRTAGSRVWGGLLGSVVEVMAAPSASMCGLAEPGEWSGEWPGERIHEPCRQICERRVDLSPSSLAWTGPASCRSVGMPWEWMRSAADIALSLVALLLLAPFLVMIAAAVCATSEGPVLYFQERSGRHGRVFFIAKFRTMKVDAEADGPRWASSSDSRVTPIGRFLRLTRLDELPQLFNVLAGSMSIVGPRPERPVFVEQLRAAIPHFDDRTLVKPGITGWAQINHPYGASIDDARIKLSYDLYYLKHRSLLLDVQIIAQTVRTMLFCHGAR